MALIKVNAQHREFYQRFGQPPLSVTDPIEYEEGSTPCTPRRKAGLTALEWYKQRDAEEKAVQAVREARSRSEVMTYPQGESTVIGSRKSTTQAKQLTVTQKMNQLRQLADTSGMTDTYSEDGIYWFSLDMESEEVR